MRVLTVVKCGIGDCSSVFKTEEAVSPNVGYVCKSHTETEQRIFFQEHQFDKDISRSGKPIGTSHIHRQGWVSASADGAQTIVNEAGAMQAPKKEK